MTMSILAHRASSLVRGVSFFVPLLFSSRAIFCCTAPTTTTTTIGPLCILVLYSTTTMPETRTEKVLFLYGSQTGNSEAAAKELCDQASTKLSSLLLKKLTGTKDTIIVEGQHMQLDDFLELERAAWTRLIVIVVSSYGVGQAPLGAYRFRELCDAWAESKSKNILSGVHFALCGLGDSKYTTFFQNPTKINDTLLQVGAERVGPLGKADASGTGAEAQMEVIDKWIKEIWPHLAQVVVKEPLSNERLDEMQQQTVALCRKINPDFLPGPKFNTETIMSVGLAVLVALLAIAYYTMSTSQ